MSMESFLPDTRSAYLELSLGAHAAYMLQYHLVWSVRARRRLLTGPVGPRLEVLLHEIAVRAGVTILAMHIEPEHVHLLLSLTPQHALADVVHQLKGASARFLRAEYPPLQDVHTGGLWSAGYFVRSLGAVNVAQAKANLDRQRAHHHEAEIGEGVQ